MTGANTGNLTNDGTRGLRQEPLFTPTLKADVGPCGTCFFRCAVSDAAHRLITQRRVIKTWARGDYLMHSGEEPHGLWAVCRGSVKIFQETEEGKYLTLRIAGPGDLVGHRSLLAHHAFWGSGVALEETVTAYLSAEVVRKIIGNDEHVRDEIIQRLASDMGHAESLATTMAYRSAEQRLLGAIWELCRRTDGCHDHDPIEIVAPRQELAELAGITVEATVRTLRRLEAAMLVAAHGRRITIYDPHKLTKLVSFCES